MAKKTKKRKSYFNRKKSRRRSGKRFSILTGIGMVAGVTASLSDRASILESVMHSIKGEWGWDETGRNLIAQTIGYDTVDKKWRLPTFTAMIIGSTIASKIAGGFVKPSTFDAIPFFGKKIKL